MTAHVNCDVCGARAVWAQRSPAADSPTYLCDDDAADVDLDQLTELGGLP